MTSFILFQTSLYRMYFDCSRPNSMVGLSVFGLSEVGSNQLNLHSLDRYPYHSLLPNIMITLGKAIEKQLNAIDSG